MADVAFAPNGHVYVADGYSNARVLQFYASGAMVREWGSSGRGPGQFRLPRGIAVGPDVNVYVADRENERVQRFSPEGSYIGEWMFGDDLFSLDFGSAGEVYLEHRSADAPRGSDGWVLKVDPRTGTLLGRFEGPVHFVAVNRAGAVFGGLTNGQVSMFVPRR